MWFFGCGAVHKGLDLLLDIFAKHRNLTLNIVGSIDCEEPDLFKIYHKELMQLPNIKFHGYIQPNNKKFLKIIKKVFCFIAPSASEGMSPACITCMQLGLFPIISRQCGITLPNNNGFYLETCSIEEIEEKIFAAYQMNKEELSEQIHTCQEYALKKFSRKAFVNSFKEACKRINFS